MRWSRMRTSLAASAGRQAAASSAARPSPAIAATFSVPERRPRSWPPPGKSGHSSTPSRTYKAPTPFGPCSLCPESESRSMGCVRMSKAILPTACTASVWKSTPRRRATWANSANRLDRADHVVGRHDGNQPRFRPYRPFQIGRIDQSLAVDRQPGHRHAPAVPVAGNKPGSPDARWRW